MHRSSIWFTAMIILSALVGSNVRAEQSDAAPGEASTRGVPKQKPERISRSEREMRDRFDLRYLRCDGGAVNGPLKLHCDPSNDREAATKKYVDDALANLLATLSPLFSHKDAWLLNGNAGTGNANFLGTTDLQPFELRVNNQRAFRIEPPSPALTPDPNNHDNAVNIIGGSPQNSVGSMSSGCTISGGGHGLNANTIGDHLEGATVGGGESNINGELFGTIAGGFFNILGGKRNGTIVGGANNIVGSFSLGADVTAGTVGGGQGNQVTASFATIAGGNSNTAGGQWSAIVGGRENVASGDYAFAAGRQAQALKAGEFVWADSNDKAFPAATLATNANDFLVRATGGSVFVSAIDTDGNATAGTRLPAGGGSWISLSDRNSKANFQRVNSREILDKVVALPVESWNYRAQSDDIRHIGPMSQDFRAAFGVGDDDRGIATVDADGVALAAIQGLHQLMEEKDQQIKTLQQQNAAMEERMKKLEAWCERHK